MKRKAFVLALIISVQLHGQIIADHSIVDQYKNIPQQYVDSVKKMWVDIPGESHSSGYRIGIHILDTMTNGLFKAMVRESGTPDGYCDTALRISRASWGDISHVANWRYGYGEEDWFTSALAIERTKAHLTYANTNNLEIAAMGFGWCWDMVRGNNEGGIDPVYQMHWSGSSVGGIDGDTIWGLNAEDSILTGNTVCMDTYLASVVEYMNHCKTNNYPTKVFFTTGPADSYAGQQGYQRHIKDKYLRDFVNTSDQYILFDYADILCWNNEGKQYTRTWTDLGGTLQTFPFIHPDNMVDFDGNANDGDHIGQQGTVRLAKALWWMLARIAGWDGDTIPQYKTRIYATICEGESYEAGGDFQTVSGIYYDTLTSIDLLDSIIITKLTVNQVHETMIDASIYPGESYFVGRANQTTSGTYYDTLINAHGCDSIVITNLTVNQASGSVVNVAICEGESYFAQGREQNITGTYYDTLINAYGCDSVVKTNLIVEKCTGIKAPDTKVNINIYPVPTRGIINVEYDNFEKMELYTLTGKLLHSTTEKTIELYEYNYGFYVLKIKTMDGHYVVKKIMYLK